MFGLELWIRRQTFNYSVTWKILHDLLHAYCEEDKKRGGFSAKSISKKPVTPEH